MKKVKLQGKRISSTFVVKHRDKVITEIDMSAEFPTMNFAGQLSKLPVHTLTDDVLLLEVIEEQTTMLSRFHETSLTKFVKRL